MDRNNTSLVLRLLKRHEKKWKTEEQLPFDSTPMGDVAFLLLIFFIVTTSFILREGIFFSLPSKTAGTIKLDENLIVDVYPRETGFMYKDTVYKRIDFKKFMKKQLENYPKTVMVIKMRPDIRYERLVDTMSVAVEIGLRRVSLKNVGTDE